MSTAVIVVDVQNDFCEGGSLAVSGGAALAGDISSWLATGGHDHAVATRDAHVDPGPHFSAEPNYTTSWPPHCVAGTPGAKFHPNLAIDRLIAVFDKGQYSSGYSGFEGRSDAQDATLADWLRGQGVTSVELVGIATDHCVRATALDAVREGFATTVRLDLTAGVSAETTDAAVEEMRAAGVTLVGTARLSS